MGKKVEEKVKVWEKSAGEKRMEKMGSGVYLCTFFIIFISYHEILNVKLSLSTGMVLIVTVISEYVIFG